MLLSHSHRFVFIKPPKTAGSSVESALRLFCVANSEPEGVSAHIWPETISGAGIVTESGNTVPVTGLKPHMSIYQARTLIGAPIFDDYLKISIVREPFSRAISLFWWHLRQNQPDSYHALAKAPATEVREAFQGFLLGNRPFVKWARLERFTNPRALGPKRFIIRFEHLHEDFNSLIRELGGNPNDMTLPAYKTRVNPRRIADADHYSLISRQLIRNLWRKDFSQHGYPRVPKR
ncbi:sulfotransferase [Pontimonas salivibrio]|uniref:Sulfotransferase n=1 Tax=Pontimonas salivibrio TaxID=1159327 RepID=A0A2L2BMZ0_9MICO|nr:sulfotransferase family 2 domain-containing protein [Pontimonas salivibrio]AVG23035.1 sulfotransferase [Pontimonas salivibrio]